MSDAQPEVVRRVAIAIDRTLPAGVAANVAACVAAGLSAAVPGWAGQPLADTEGVRSASSSHLPLPILAATPEQLQALLGRASPSAPEGAALVVFPRFAQTLHDVETYWREHRARALRQEALLGCGVVGPGAWVRSLTGALALYR